MAKNAVRRSKRRHSKALERINHNAAGIDAGSERHFVAVPEDRDTESVKSFGTVTSELYRLADWLVQCLIDTVAIEATGVYCIPLMEVLEARGITVVLVKPSSLKSVNDFHKSDMIDAQWIQTLHTFNLLRASFRPSKAVHALRTLARHRRSLIEDGADLINRISKTLVSMNIRLDQAVTDIAGETGMKILRSIIAGERNPEVLAKFRDKRCAKSEEQIAEALTGYYGDEQLLVLAQTMKQWDLIRLLISECDKDIERTAGRFEKKASRETMPKPRMKEKVRKNVLTFDARTVFYEALGVDLTQIDGVSTSTIAVIISEIGTNVDAWDNEKKFCSWLRVCPGANITGGKRRDARNRPTSNRVAIALRMAAQSLERSSSALGAFYRRLKARRGPEKAIRAAASKLARMIYHSIKEQRTYVDPGEGYFDQRHSARALKHLSKRAERLGYTLVKAA